MASLWNKLTASNKISLPSSNEEASRKRTRKQSLSARSRKSLAQIFPYVYADPLSDKENASAAESDVKCEEAGNYPLYDPENPDHNTAYHSSSRRSRSWSPLKEQIQRGKATLRSKSPSPTRLLTSSRKALNEFTNSVKATAAAMRPSTPPALLQDIGPIGQDSEKSVKSKKSVHWRSSESTTMMRGSDGPTSPKDIPKGPSLILPDFNYSDHFLGSKIILTARPPQSQVLSTLEQAYQRPESIELQPPVITDITQPPLLTPMPGTNLPLEDPFDDAAAIPEKGDFKIFEDPVCDSDCSSASSEPIPDVAVVVSGAPSASANLAVPDCLGQHLPSRSSSKAYDADDDSRISEDSDAEEFTARVHPKPATMRVPRVSSIDSMNIDSAGQDLKAAIPRIEVSSPNGGTTQSTLEAGNLFSLGLALDDSDKENQCQKQPLVEMPKEVGEEQAKGGQFCSAPPLPVPGLTTARKLPPFHLHASMMSTSPLHDGNDSSDESMSIVDETVDYLQARKDSLNVGNGRTRTPSPAGVLLPETPMSGMI